MIIKTKRNYVIVGFLFILMVFSCIVISNCILSESRDTNLDEPEKKDFIKYVEFNVPYFALEKAMNIDIESQKEVIKINWIEVLAYLSAKYGGNFKQYKESDMENVVSELKNGKTIEELTKKMKCYSYYHEVYTAILGEYLGNYTEKNSQEEKYGLKVFSPIAKTYPFSHCDDFGTSRSYGYKRRHLGHDLMSAVGTPVIAIESGTVEVLGWNQYGGWRIGIRSFDKKRYYYYAHLRQNRPYHIDLSEGKIVNAGDVIGYVGRTGYSSNENTNNIQVSHLHLGLELVFDESQKESNNEIWINLYDITRLLEKNKAPVTRNKDTKEFYGINQIEQ